jgi:hypothetical protein
MTEENKTIFEYFPNIKIRTMKTDLEGLRQGGGIVQFSAQEKPQKDTDFLYEEQRSREIEITPPSLEIPTEPIQPTKTLTKEETAEERVEKQQLPSNKQNLLLIISISVLGLILLGSLIFWVIYPNIAKEFAKNELSPTPTVTEVPSPIPSPASPAIAITGAEKIRLIMEKQIPAELIQKIKLETLLPKQAGDLIVYDFLNNQGKYLSSSQLIQLVAPDSLASFKSSPDEEYLIFSLWIEKNESKTGVVFSIKPEMIEVVKSIMKSWETANVEEYFPVVFLPETPLKRELENFKDVIISSSPARKLNLGSSEFIYGFLNNYLIITSDSKSFEKITQLIK